MENEGNLFTRNANCVPDLIHLGSALKLQYPASGQRLIPSDYLNRSIKSSLESVEKVSEDEPETEFSDYTAEYY